MFNASSEIVVVEYAVSENLVMVDVEYHISSTGRSFTGSFADEREFKSYIQNKMDKHADKTGVDFAVKFVRVN